MPLPLVVRVVCLLFMRVRVVFLDDIPRLRLFRCPLLRLLVSVRLLVVLVVCLLFVRVRVVFLDDTPRLRLLVVHLFRS